MYHYDILYSICSNLIFYTNFIKKFFHIVLIINFTVYLSHQCIIHVLIDLCGVVGRELNQTIGNFVNINMFQPIHFIYSLLFSVSFDSMSEKFLEPEVDFSIEEKGQLPSDSNDIVEENNINVTTTISQLTQLTLERTLSINYRTL